MTSNGSRTALVLSGGGARGAYQVGVLRGLVEHGFLPRAGSPVRIFVGASAGSINATALAAHVDDLEQGLDHLEQVWRTIQPQQVFRTDIGSLGRIGARWVWDLSFGGVTRRSQAKALLDTAPLARLLAERIPFERIEPNVRAGARGPVAGMMHSLFLLSFMAMAAPLAYYIPLATLAALLAVVAWNMAERHAFAILLRASKGDAVVLLATFLLVVFVDLTTGILAGFGIGALLFLHRMAHAVEVESDRPLIRDDQPDGTNGDDRSRYDTALATDRDIIVYRISGAFFFGAAASVAMALDRIGEHPKAYVIDVSGVPMLDSTAATTIGAFARKAAGAGAVVHVAGARPPIQRVLWTHGVRPPGVHFAPNVTEAIAAARVEIAQAG